RTNRTSTAATTLKWPAGSPRADRLCLASRSPHLPHHLPRLLRRGGTKRVYGGLARLGLPDLVNGELLHVRRPLHFKARLFHCLLDTTPEEGVVVRTRFPEVEDAPPLVDRARGVKQKPLRRL